MTASTSACYTPAIGHRIRPSPSRRSRRLPTWKRSSNCEPCVDQVHQGCGRAQAHCKDKGAPRGQGRRCCNQDDRKGEETLNPQAGRNRWKGCGQECGPSKCQCAAHAERVHGTGAGDGKGSGTALL